jgi:hypothetical protein
MTKMKRAQNNSAPRTMDAYVLIIADLMRQLPSWKPHDPIGDARKKTARAETLSRWHRFGREFVPRATWASMIENALAPQRTEHATQAMKAYAVALGKPVSELFPARA